MIPELESIADKTRSALSDKDAARELALRLSREVIRYSADAIRAIHRGEFDAARALLGQARSHLAEAAQALLPQHADIFHAGFVHNAQKEYAEANITLALVRGEPMPDAEALSVEHAAYLNGMGEAAGELRRHLLDRLRRGELEGCEDILSAMDDIYNVVVTMDFPDAVTGGLRRTADMVRGVLERTRGDLTVFLRQRDLEQKLEAFSRLLRPGDTRKT